MPTPLYQRVQQMRKKWMEHTPENPHGWQPAAQKVVEQSTSKIDGNNFIPPCLARSILKPLRTNLSDDAHKQDQ